MRTVGEQQGYVQNFQSTFCIVLASTVPGLVLSAATEYLACFVAATVGCGLASELPPRH